MSLQSTENNMRQTLFEEASDGIFISHVIRESDYDMPTRHIHDEYEIYYLIEGERYYFIGRDTYRIKKGDMVFINKNVIHKTGGVSEPYHNRMLIEFSEEPFNSYFSTFGNLGLEAFFEKNTGIISLEPQEQNFVEKTVLGMHYEIHNKKIGYRLSVMNKLASLILFAMRKSDLNMITCGVEAKAAKHGKVDEVVDYIVSHCTQKISLESVAANFYINKCYLSRIFKETTSFTVNEYINIHRINKAQELLATTNIPVAQIARMCGFESLTYFERVFRTYREISPLKYRNRYRQNILCRPSKGEDLN